MSAPDPLAITHDATGPDPALADAGAADEPTAIGRYRVERLLGRGGFGRVYLASDDRLQRLVAVKVPDPELVAHAGDVESYLVEARTVAGLDHPHIVPVFDVGSATGFPCFVVSRYLNGGDLIQAMHQAPIAARTSAELIASIAEALHYAHTKGIVPRDVKPGNILLDSQRRAYITDFGLALKEMQHGRGPNFAGTPA